MESREFIEWFVESEIEDQDEYLVQAEKVCYEGYGRENECMLW